MPQKSALTKLAKTQAEDKGLRGSRKMMIVKWGRVNGRYSFDLENLVLIMERLVEEGELQLPEPIRLDEVGQVDAPNYYKYHRILGHETEECLILKGKVQRLINQGTIKLKTKETSRGMSAIVSITPAIPLIHNERPVQVL